MNSPYGKKYTMRGRLRKVFLKCSRCGRSIHIRTNDKGLYTPDVRKSFVCIFCQTQTQKED